MSRHNNIRYIVATLVLNGLTSGSNAMCRRYGRLLDGQLVKNVIVPGLIFADAYRPQKPRKLGPYE